MKDKVLIFIVGVLIGAILTTGVFMIINKNNINGSDNNRQFNRGNGAMTSGEGIPIDIEGMQLIDVDGDVKTYVSPDGGMLKEKRGPEGSSGTMVNPNR